MMGEGKKCRRRCRARAEDEREGTSAGANERGLQANNGTDGVRPSDAGGALHSAQRECGGRERERGRGGEVYVCVCMCVCVCV